MAIEFLSLGLLGTPYSLQSKTTGGTPGVHLVTIIIRLLKFEYKLQPFAAAHQQKKVKHQIQQVGGQKRGLLEQ